MLISLTLFGTKDNDKILLLDLIYPDKPKMAIRAQFRYIFFRAQVS